MLYKTTLKQYAIKTTTTITHTNKQTCKQANEQTNKQTNYKLVKHKSNCKLKIQPYVDTKQQLNYMQYKRDQK